MVILANFIVIFVTDETENIRIMMSNHDLYSSWASYSSGEEGVKHFIGGIISED